MYYDLLDKCDFQGGTQPPKDKWIKESKDGYVRMLQIRDFSQSDDKFIEYVKDSEQLHKCKKDDIMLSRYGYIGQAFMGLEGAYNVALVKVIKKNSVNTKYLYYYFKSNVFKHYLLSNVGARETIPGFNKSELKDAKINIKPLDEQIQIVKILERCEDIINKLNKEIEDFDLLIKARFTELFGTVKDNPYHFPTATLKEVCHKITDGKHGGCEQEADSGYYYVGAREIYDGVIHYDTAPQITYADFAKDYRRCNIEQGDMVIVNTGATIGKSAIASSPLTERTLLQKSVALIKVKTDVISAKFLRFCYMANPSMYLVESASAQPNLLLSKMNATAIYLPPIELQEQFVAFVEQTDKSKLAVQQSLEKTQLLFDSLMQEYFGEN